MDAAWKRAVERGDVETVRQTLRAGADINARDSHGQTALMLAAHRGDLQMVETFVAAGADLDATAKYNLSALMLAIVAGHEAVARTLARAGADLRIRGRGAPGFEGQTAHDLAIARGMNDLGVDLRRR